MTNREMLNSKCIYDALNEMNENLIHAEEQPCIMRIVPHRKRISTEECKAFPTCADCIEAWLNEECR